MSKLADIFCRWLIKSGAISSNDQELYQYAIYSFSFEFTPLLLAIIVGMLLQMPLESILFIFPFLLIRKFSGGYHLQSATVCFCLSSMVLFSFLLFIKWMLVVQRLFVFSLICSLAAFGIIILSPIDSEARRLSSREKKIFRKIAIMLTVMVLSGYVLCLAFGWTHMAIPMGSGLILTALLQLPCLFKRGKKST